MRYEPTGLEMLLTRLAFHIYGKSVYKAFADCLPLNGNEKVLDFWCGIGSVAYYTAQRLTDGHLVCVDISERCIENCRKTLRNFENITFLHAQSLFLPESGFDVIYCHFVLHDISETDLEKVIPELAKALKSEGYLVFREPLNQIKKLGLIKQLITDNNLSHKESRIIDIPSMGSTLESIYIKL
jgi:ubiquinone/menaquinone biosynthesis C-methylase UbiE